MSSRQSNQEGPLSIGLSMSIQKLLALGPSEQTGPDLSSDLMVVDGTVYTGPAFRDTRSDTVSRPAPDRPTLNNLPSEVFGLIASFLQPVWLYNWSHAYSDAWYKLSIEGGGNRIWYETMPPSMWLEPEAYQARIMIVNHDDTPRAEFRDKMRQVKTILGGDYDGTFDYHLEVVGRLSEPRCMICLRPRDHPWGRLTNAWGVTWCDACFDSYTICRSYLISYISLRHPEVAPAKLRYTFEDTPETQHYLHHRSPRSYVPEVNSCLHNPGSLNLLELQSLRAAFRGVLKRLQRDPTNFAKVEVRRLIVDVAEAIWDGKDISPVLRAAGRMTRVRLNSMMYSRDPERYRWFRERFAPTELLRTFLFPEHLLQHAPSETLRDNGYYLRDPAEKLIREKFKSAKEVPNKLIVKAARSMVDQLAETAGFGFPMFSRTVRLTTWTNAAWEWHKTRLLRDVSSGAVMARVGDIVGPLSSTRNVSERIKRLRFGLGLEDSNGDLWEMPPIPNPADYRDSSGLHNNQRHWSPLSADQLLSCAIATEHDDSHASSMSPASCDAFSEAMSSLDDNSAPLKYHNKSSDFRFRRDYDIFKAKEAHLRQNWALFNRNILETCNRCPITCDVFYPPGLDGLLKHMQSCHISKFYGTDDFKIIG